MNAPFPFGFPAPTAFYLTLYILTLALHVLPMTYVLGGLLYLVGAHFARRTPNPPIAATLRDWLPFALSAAITAGVAPLLFVQILYKPNFYTANLLLLHGWMALLPVLIVGFYLLYVMKTGFAERRPALLRVVTLIAAACVVFVAAAWTRNHLLMLRSDLWPTMYAGGQMTFPEARFWPRLGMWLAASLAGMAFLAAWQIRALAARGRLAPEAAEAAQRELAAVALGGLLGALVAAIALAAIAFGDARRAFTDMLTWPYAAGTIVAAAAAAYSCIRVRRRRSAGWWAAGTTGFLLSVVGVCVVREGVRLAAVDIEKLYTAHAAAAQVGGLGAFLVFAGISVVLLGTCALLVRRAAGAGAAP